MKIILIAMSVLCFYVANQFEAPQNKYQTYFNGKPVPSATPEVQVQEVPPSNSPKDWESQVYESIVAHGFPDPKLMLAIAKAESSLRIDAVGDVSLQNSTWGPSVGVFQIRTLKTQNKGCRDQSALSNNLAAQTSCAKQIFDSQGLRAWSAYTNGSYKRFI